MAIPEADSAELRSPTYPTAYPPGLERGDSDWEYEYDGNETEDYYFTLDVTTHQNERATNSKPPAKRRKLSGPDTNNEQSEKPDTAAAINSSIETTATGSNQNRKLQVLDLEGDNPLVLLDGQLYSCSWSTDLGSQFYVAQAKTTEKPRRAGRALDVVGLSRARLVGKPITARPRANVSATASVGSTAANAIAVEEESHGEVNEGDPDEPDASLADESPATEQASRMPPAAATPQAQARRSFLERLSAIKQKKGETDQVPMSGTILYELPSNQDEIRKASMAADAELEKSKKAKAAEGKRRGPYKKNGKKSGPKPAKDVRSSLGLSVLNG